MDAFEGRRKRRRRERGRWKKKEKKNGEESEGRNVVVRRKRRREQDEEEDEDETAQRVKKKRREADWTGIVGERGRVRSGREEEGKGLEWRDKEGLRTGAESGEAVENQRTATPHRDGRGSQSSAHLRSARVSCSVENRLRQGV